MAVRRLAEVQPEQFAFSQENRAWADHTIAKFPVGRQASAVIPLLWRAQEQEGWVSRPALEYVGEMLGMPFIRVLEVATFYTMFHLEPVGRKAHVQVCGTTPCMLAGSDAIIAACRSRIHAQPHHLSADGDFSWEEVECLGACVNAPMVQISSDTYEDLTPEIFEGLLDAFARGEAPGPGPQQERVTSTPATGLSTLTEIDYADGEGMSPRSPRGRGEAAEHGTARSGGDLPEETHGDVAGGEDIHAEERRRKGETVEEGGGANPAAPETAGQEAGRVDPTGRSDEAASRAMGSGESEGN